MPYKLTVALCKGRVLDETRDLWIRARWPWPLNGSRQLWFPPTDERPGVIIARGQDIPPLVQRGIAAFGIVGRDVLEEQEDAEVLEVLDLVIAPCRMVLAALDSKWPDGPVQVASKYPSIALRFLSDHGYAAEVVSLSGSLELAPHIGLAPYIVDVVQTGRTLREHRLKEITTLFSSSARLIANPITWRLEKEAELVYDSLSQAVNLESVSRCERKGAER